jgi:hypothetical protein
VGDERLACSRGEVARTRTAGLLDSSPHLPQQVFQLLGSGLLVLFFQVGQLAEMVDVAQRMAAAGVPVVRLPAVMHAHPHEVRQDAYGVGRLRAALGVDGGYFLYRWWIISVFSLNCLTLPIDPAYHSC